jgi:peroxiredoxin (alkyl hydroperoxide reductase subunit C)
MLGTKGGSMVQAKDGCVKPSKGPIMPEMDASVEQPQVKKEVVKMLARVGKPAPDFELSAYFEGGFKNVRLSDHKGKWIVICFYPGDFTFV